MKTLCKLLGIIAIGAVIGIGLAGCANPADSEDTADSGDEPKTLVITGINAADSQGQDIQIGIFQAGTSPEQALERAGFVAGADSREGSARLSGSGPYAVTAELYDPSGNRWTGSGVYDIYIEVSSGQTGHLYFRKQNVPFDSASISVSATSFLPLSPSDWGGAGSISAPTGLTAIASGNSISLYWNSASGADYYRVYRSSSEYGGYSQINASVYSLNYTDWGLPAGTYYYKVSAVSYSYGESLQSGYDFATISGSSGPGPSAPTGLTAIASGNSISLYWNSVSGADYYRVYRRDSEYGSYSQIGYDAYGPSYSDWGLAAGTYYYKVAAVSSNYGESPQSVYASATISVSSISAPTGLTATASSDSISLYWNSVSSASYYKVYRSSSEYGGYSQIGGLVYGTSYTDSGLSAGTYYYKVVAVSYSNGESPQSGYASATIEISAPTITNVAVTPNSTTVRRGETQTFTATVEGTGNPAQTVTWSVESASLGTSITSGGVLTVGAGESSGHLTIRATSTVDTSKSGTATVTVSSPTITNVAVTPSSTTVRRGETQTFTATVEGTGNPAQTVTWSVESASLGTSITSEGVLTVGANETASSLTVRATSTYDTTQSGTAAVTVPSTVTSVTVIPASAMVNRGGTQTFTATVHGMGNPAQTVTWSVEGASSGTSITSGGVLTVGADETPGSLTVRATSTVDTSKSGTAAVTVTPPIVNSVTVSPATASVKRGETKAFTATVSGTYGPALTVIWSVEGGGSGTAISNTTGLLTVAANETAGNLTVRATSTADTSKSGTATVTVLPPEEGTKTVILVYPTDAASGELSDSISVSAGSPVTLGTNDVFDTYRWRVDGLVKEATRTFTLNAGNYSPGIHQLSLEVTLNGAVYSKSGVFTVQ